MEVQRMYLCKLLSLFYWIPLISSQNSGSNVSVQPKPNVIIDDILTNCVLRPVDLSITSKVDKMIQNGAKLIHIDFIVLNFTGTLHEESKGKVYKPLSWVLTTNRQGRSILLLRPQYEILSLNTLSLGTERTTVIITQSPSNCLTNNNSTVVSNYLREFLLYKFKTPIRGSNDTVADATFKEQEQACNLNIASKEQKASFYYSCCRKTSNGQTICEELTWDNYVILLFVCIYVFDFFAVMFIPMLIPSSLYRDKYETTCYEYELETPLTLVMQKTPEHVTKDNVFPISYFDQMNEFKKTIQKMQYDVTYEMTLKKLHILTETSKLIPPNSVPVGLFESLYSALFKCEIRKKASITDCCNSNLLGPCTPLGFKLPWFKCLQFFMLVLLYIAMTAFWIVRVVVFYTYENSDRMEKEKAATDRNLELWYTLDLTWTLTPVHILFLICYGVFAADVIIFGILTRHVATTLNHVMRRCLRDMREISRTRAFGWSIQILIHPFKHCGIFGVLFALFYYIPAVPIVTLTLAFYCLPTINILVRLLIYFVAYLFPYGRNCLTNRCCMKLKQLWRYIRRVFRMDILTNPESIARPERISVKYRFLELIVILACLMTILSSVILAMECIVFFAEVFMYTLIGIIINASSTLQYLTLFFLLVFYARDCFSTISKEYLAYNKFLHKYFINKLRLNVEKISNLDQEVQKNTAFQMNLETDNNQKNEAVPLEFGDKKLETYNTQTNEAVPLEYGDKKLETDNNQSNEAVSLEFGDKKMKWRTNRLILFLDKNDTPYITSKFFFDTCSSDLVGVPGTLLSSLLRAMQNFVLICIFLFFVAIVILSFGEEYGISTTNRMFATLAGGFLPYFLRSILFKEPPILTVDDDNLSFKSKFQRAIRDYTQTWDVADFHILNMKPMNTPNRLEDTVLAGDNKSATDMDVMLEEIDHTSKDQMNNRLDIVIYEKFTV